jgi:outer membrane protein assembly factor BamB
LLRQWPEKGPPVLWRAPIQIGWSCPSIAGDDVVLIMADFVEPTPNRQTESIVCLDAATGKQRWKYDYKVSYHYCEWWQGGPRGTPTITDKHVYTLGIMGQLTCVDRKTGALVWQLDLEKEGICSLKKMTDVKGYAQSPVVVNGKVILNLCQPDTRGKTVPEQISVMPAKIIGVDAETGKLAWTYEEPFRAETIGNQAGTVSTVEFNGEQCALTFTNRFLVILRAADGKKLWSYDYLPPGAHGTSTAPLLLYGDKALFTPNLAGELHLMQVDWKTPSVKKLWDLKSAKDLRIWSFLPFVLHHGNVYGFGDVESDANKWKYTKSLVCIDGTTGAMRWKSEAWQGATSFMAADGLLFVRSFQTLRLVEANPDSYVEKGKMENLHQGASKSFYGPGLIDFVTPVLSRGRLYVRLPDNLLCLDVKSK